MASTYSNLKIQLMATGENSTTWGNVTNINLGTALEEAIVGSVDVAFSSADVTLTLTDTNATQSARNMRLNLTGTATSGYNLVVPAIEKPYIINNATDGTITVKNATGTGIAVPTGKTMWVYNNGTNVVAVTTHLTSLTLGAALPVASGGTGQTTYTDGQLLIGNSTGNTLTKATLTAGSGITITNGAGSISIAATSGGGGTVTSVNATTAISGLSFSGGPVTTSGTLTLSGTLGVAGGGTGLASLTSGAVLIGAGTSSVLSVSPGTLNNVLTSNGTTWVSQAGSGSGTVTSVSVVSTNGFAGTVATANVTPAITITTTITGIMKGNGTSVSSATAGTDYVVPGGALGTPSSGTLTNCTFPTLNQNTTGSAATFTSTSQNSQFNSVGVGTAGSTTAGEIRATNNVTAFYSSDARLKENVQIINNALGIVTAVGGKTFDWTQEYIAEHGGEDGYFVRKSDFGVIAQDVQAVFPVAVRERGDGTLAVDYEKLVAVAFQAIAELRAEVDALRGVK
jgi:hypothetical protein